MSDVDATQDPAAEPAVADGQVDPNEAPLSEGDDAGAAVDADAAADVADASDPGADVGVADDASAFSPAPGITIPEGVELTFGGSFSEFEYRGLVLELDKKITSKAERREQIDAFIARRDAELEGVN